MAFACTCDRCGKVVPSLDRKVGSVKLGIYSYRSNNFTTNDEYDLCDDCYKALKKWIKNDQKSKDE